MCCRPRTTYSVQQCCAVTQWLLRMTVISLHGSAAKLNTLPYWSLLHRSESGSWGKRTTKQERGSSQTQAKQENISAQLSPDPEISLIRCAQQLIFLDPTTFIHRQRVVIMLYRKVLRAGRNYEVRITLDKKIIACQHRLSGLETKLIIMVGSVGAEKHGKQGGPSPAQSPDY